MRQFGLIGYPLSHSFSPGYFAEKFKRERVKDAEYQAYSIPHISEVFYLFESGIYGLNVTIPYKEQVIPCLDELEISAKEIGAVNTIKISNGRTIGYNTDVYGFQKSIEPFLDKIRSKKALILGTGGASKAVAYALELSGFDFKFVSRTKGDFNYEHLNKETLDLYHLIINTTPLGMYPKVDQCPDIPYQYLNKNHFAYDLTYNPEKTLFLSKAESQGASIKNGLEMLELQAEKSWSIWNTK